MDPFGWNLSTSRAICWTNESTSEWCSVAVRHSAIDSKFTVSPAANRPTTEVSIDQHRCSYVTERTSQAFSANHGCELWQFQSSSFCSLFVRPCVCTSTAHTRTGTSVTRGETDGDPVAPATAETAAMIDSKGKAALAKKFSFLANNLQAATSTGTLFMVTNQETVQGQLNRYISDLTETNLDTENAIEFWSERMATYKPHLHLTFCKRQHHRHSWREFSLSVVWWLQGKEIGWKHPFRCVHF